MYLHIGNNAIVRKSSIVAVCDLDNTTTSSITRDTLARAEKQGRVTNAGDDLPKSFVLSEQDGESVFYLSQLAPATLAKRSESELEKL